MEQKNPATEALKKEMMGLIDLVYEWKELQHKMVDAGIVLGEIEARPKLAAIRRFKKMSIEISEGIRNFTRNKIEPIRKELDKN